MNRILRLKSEGWEYEADQRHAELIVRGMGLEKAKGVKTPGEEVPSWKLDEEERPIEKEMITKFRMLAARANYLAADRPDIQFSVKECCRGMAAPLHKHWNLLKRLGRYLSTRQRMVMHYPWQGNEGMKAYSDSDWAGCKRTARSTSWGE